MKPTDLSILVVDDEAPVLESLTEALRSLGEAHRVELQVHPARSATDALGVLDESAIDCLIVDYDLKGGMSGAELIERMYDPLGLCRVMLISGCEERELEGPVMRNSHRLGRRFSFLSKPIKPLELKSRFVDLMHFVQERPLPHPCATALARIDRAETWFARLGAVRDLLETLAGYAVAILVADRVRRQGAWSGGLHQEKTRGFGSGTWLAWLKTLLQEEECLPGSPFVGELQAFFARPVPGGQGLLGSLMRFKDDVRIPELGHGRVREEAFYRKVTQDWAPVVDSIRGHISFLSRYALLCVERMSFSDRGGVDYTARALLGEDLPAPLFTFNSVERLLENRCYLGHPTSGFLDLHPLVRFDLCPQCEFRRVFLADNLSGRKLVSLSACGHRVEDAGAFRSLVELVSGRGGGC